MTKNLESADRILKITLALMVLICYVLGVISGPFGVLLLVLSGALMVSFSMRLLFDWMTID